MCHISELQVQMKLNDRINVVSQCYSLVHRRDERKQNDAAVDDIAITTAERFYGSRDADVVLRFYSPGVATELRWQQNAFVARLSVLQ